MPYIHAGACGRTALSSIVTFLADEGNCVSNYAEAQPEGLQFGSNDAGNLSRFLIVLPHPTIPIARGSQCDCIACNERNVGSEGYDVY